MVPPATVLHTKGANSFLPPFLILRGRRSQVGSGGLAILAASWMRSWLLCASGGSLRFLTPRWLARRMLGNLQSCQILFSCAQVSFLLLLLLHVALSGLSLPGALQSRDRVAFRVNDELGAGLPTSQEVGLKTAPLRCQWLLAAEGTAVGWALPPATAGHLACAGEAARAAAAAAVGTVSAHGCTRSKCATLPGWPQTLQRHPGTYKHRQRCQRHTPVVAIGGMERLPLGRKVLSQALQLRIMDRNES